MLINLDLVKDRLPEKIRGVIHIGAHHGQEIEAYDKLDVKALLMFEASSRNFAILQDYVNAYKASCIQEIKLENKAIGDRVSRTTMYVETAHSGQSNSLLRPKNR